MAPPARIDELKKRYEENPRRFFAPLANEYRKAGDLDAAIDLCRTHLEEQPGHLSGHIVYGQALFESSRTGDAKTIFEAALTLDPENLIALRHLGDIAKVGGDATAARHWYGRVLEADPRNDEVTALIDALGQTAPTVVVAEQHAPPPPPDYASQAAAARTVDPSAPTPAVPVAAVPAVAVSPAPAAPAPTASAPRLSIGLMDLDLNLADTTQPTVDLLSITPAEPAAPAMPAVPAGASLANDVLPVVEEPAPAFDEGFALLETASTTQAIEGAGVPGVEGISLGAGVETASPADVLDTSFDAPPAEDESMFAAPHAEPSFGDSLDVTASSDVDTFAAPAAPASAATPADFDALFGNAPIADVQVGGDLPAVPVEEAGFHADSFVGRKPSDEVLAAAPDIAAPPSPFVTETMAELYLQQGFRDEALNVYRQLLAQNPDDHGLAERVMHLEHGTRSSLAIDSVSEAIEAEEVRKSGGIPTVSAEPVSAPAVPQPEPEPVMEMMLEPEPPSPEAVAPLAEAVPAFLVEAPAVPVEAPAVPVEASAAPVGAPESAAGTSGPVAVGPRARDILARIASRRAVPGGGVAVAVATMPEADRLAASETAFDEPSTTSTVAATASVSVPFAADGEVTLAPGGAVDQLFGLAGVVAADEGAAVAIASAFGAAPPVAPIRGEPTRLGTDELSLDSVFGSDGPARPSMVQRQSSTLRFDQFFSAADGGDAAPAAPPPTASPAAGDDIAQFSDWLKGLKGS